LTTSPTATSSLLFGLATYVFLGASGFLGGVDVLGTFGNVSLGARDHVEDDRGLDFEIDDASDRLGESLRCLGTVRNLDGVSPLCGVMLVLRCLEAYVDPLALPSVLETDRTDCRLGVLPRRASLPDTARRVGVPPG
jgi:hypothetical protein